MTKKGYCATPVKNVLKHYHHKKCYGPTRKSSIVSSNAINNWLKKERNVKDHGLLDPDKDHQVCYTFNKMIVDSFNKEDSHHSSTRSESSSARLSTSSTVVEPSSSSSSSSSGTTSSSNNIINNNEQSTTATNKYNSFIESITSNKSTNIPSFRQPFSKLKMKQKKARMNMIAKLVLSACIDKEKAANQKQMYIQKNHALAVELMNFLDGVKAWIEVKVLLNLENYADTPLAPVSGDLIDSLSEEERKKKQGYDIAKTLLGSTGRNGYTAIRKQVGKMLNESDKNLIPSHYIMMKDCPTIKSVTFPVNDRRGLNSDDHNDTLQNEMINFGTVEVGDENQCIDHNSAENFGVMNLMNPDGDENNHVSCTNVGNTITASRIEGGYGCAVDIMEKKLKRRKKNHDHDGGNAMNLNDMTVNNEKETMIIIDSFDGAETSNGNHSNSETNYSNIISYSSIMHSPSSVNNGIATAGSSKNILTWQQTRGKESVELVLASVNDHYKSKQKLKETEGNNDKYATYEMHDGKMLYTLTQHSLWNRKYHPFLLCKCRRGAGIKDTSHQCRMMTNEEHLSYYNESNTRWEEKLQECTENETNYSIKEHMKWVDKHNYGISHFGIHPDLLDRSTIRFDTFHMKCQITRGIMNYTRKYLEAHMSVGSRQRFYRELEKFWNEYHSHIWESKKNFSSFKGNELALYVANCEPIVDFLKATLSESPSLNNLVKSLKLWRDIFGFLAVTTVTDDEGYTKLMDETEKKIQDLYEIVGSSLLTRVESNIGAQETFYWHALRFYMPTMIRDTYAKHSLGIGIFTMQGFERRNKETKMIYQRYNNHNGDTLSANLKKCWAIFEHDYNDMVS